MKISVFTSSSGIKMFRDGWIVLNKMPVRVCTWGCWIEDNIPGDSIILVLPGNPGIPAFYYEFLEALQPLVDMPIWLLSHGGFEKPPYGFDTPELKNNPELYNVNAQIEQKKEFIKKYIPVSKKIYIVGHSLGGKIGIVLMKDKEIGEQVKQAHLLFPCLEHIGQSPNGKFYVNVVKHIAPLLTYLAWVFSVLPRIVQIYFLTFLFWCRYDGNYNKEQIYGAVITLFNWSSLRCCLFLALDEMEAIKELDTEVYNNYSSKIYCYYGQSDRWAPLEQYNHLMKEHPKVNGTILDEKFHHAFMFDTSIDIAELLGGVIRKQ